MYQPLKYPIDFIEEQGCYLCTYYNYNHSHSLCKSHSKCKRHITWITAIKRVLLDWNSELFYKRLGWGRYGNKNNRKLWQNSCI